MSYLNRTAADNMGYKAQVYLSAVVEEYPGTLVSEKYLYAPKFEGFGIVAELHYTDHVIANYSYGYSDFYWDVTSQGVSILQVPGIECTLDICVYPADEQEIVDISFDQDQSGKYSWAGLPESNLPRTKMDVSYDPTGAWVGKVNGAAFSSASYAGFRLMDGAHADAIVYDTGGTGAQGAYEASVKYKLGTDFRGSYTYLSAATVGNYDSYWQCHATGSSVSLTGEYLHQGLLNRNYYTIVNVSSWPLAYQYHITERSGLSLAGCRFVDINGETWQGANSDQYEFAGVQEIAVGGTLNASGHAETVTPAFDAGDKWSFNDPPPAHFGSVSCLNPEQVNDYSITVTDDQDNETTYRPSRVQIYAPLGGSGDLQGDLSVSFASSVSLESFVNMSQATATWSVGGGTMSGSVVTITDAEGSLTGTGWVRQPYPGEHGQLTAAELIKHLPLCNLISLIGSGFDGVTEVVMTITCGSKEYKYSPVVKTSSGYVYDLTRPDGFRGSDEQAKYMTVHHVEQYTGSQDDPDAKYYTEEEPCQFPLYGPSLFQSISFSGFGPGTYDLSSLTASYSEADTYYQMTGEFQQVEQVGRQQIAGQDHPICRNRHGIIAKSGRFLETPNNQEDITPRGIVTWRFPTISEIEGTGGGRLLFPRDDWASVSIAASTRAQGGSPAPVADAVSEQAYIGWIEAVNGLPKIRPLVDDLTANEIFMQDFGEMECCIDLGGYWQGFLGDNGQLDLVNATGHSASAADTVQYLTKGQADGTWTYKVSGATKRTGAMETPPGFVMRYCIRHLLIHGKILRNAIGKILRNTAGKILRGDFEE